MAQTVSTSAVAVLTTAAGEVVKRVDWRVFADLCSDSGSRLASSAAVQADANFLALVRDAYAELESALTVGGRYSPADIAALVADTGVGAGKFYRVLSDVVVLLAFRRRPDKAQGDPTILKEARDTLQQLRDGERIFSFEQSADAGRMTHEREEEADVVERDGLVYQARRIFGRRGNRRNTLSGSE